MKIVTALISLAAALVLGAPAQAHSLTIRQIQQFFADTTCSHSGQSVTCTNKKDGSTIAALPDGTVAIIGPSTSQGQVGRGTGCPEGPFYWGVGCTFHSSAEDSFYHGATVTYAKVPGGTRTDPTCTVSSATLSYNGRTSGVGSVIDHLNPNKYDFSSSGPTTSAGAC